MRFGHGFAFKAAAGDVSPPVLMSIAVSARVASTYIVPSESRTWADCKASIWSKTPRCSKHPSSVTTSAFATHSRQARACGLSPSVNASGSVPSASAVTASAKASIAWMSSAISSASAPAQEDRKINPKSLSKASCAMRSKRSRSLSRLAATAASSRPAP